MAGWTCPECDRSFRRRNQSHECVPAMSVDEYFASRPDFERPIFEEVFEHLEMVGDGDVRVEAVDVGIFFKRLNTFAELRPMRGRVRLMVMLSRRMRHPKIVRRWEGSGARAAYWIDLKQPDDVDDDVRDWLIEAFLASPV
jgi:Domain of unknown function (DUF5655)